MEAAAYWAKSGGRAARDASSLLEDAAAFGIELDTESIPEPVEFEVMHENWDTVMVFIHLATQWTSEILAMTGDWIWRGLPATEIESTLRMLGLGRKAKTIFPGIRTMEREALPILNARNK